MKWLAVAVLLGGSVAAFSQQDAAATSKDGPQNPESPSVAVQLREMLQRGASGHSPTTDEIQAVESLPGVTDAGIAKTVEPLLEKALADPDAAMRRYGLAMLIGMQTLPDAVTSGTQPAPANGVAPAPAPAPTPAPKMTTAEIMAAGPAAYKDAVAKALTPLVPAIGTRLTDEDPDCRGLAATILGGFAPDPPSTVFTPLLGFLKRDDAIGAVGLAVVSDLLQYRAVSAEAVSAIGRYLQRSDQTTDSKSNLVEAVAAKQNQNQAVDRVLLTYLDSDDPTLRARTILSLPALDLTPEAFADTRAKLETIASGNQDGLQVVNAAKAVVTCWTQVKMTSGCPLYQ